MEPYRSLIMDIFQILEKGENSNIEFKSTLSGEHLEKDRRERLVSQMRYRLDAGNGTTYYILGVYDDGTPCSATREELEETLNIIKTTAREADARVTNMETFDRDGTFMRVTIQQEGKDRKKHLIVGTIGHVDHGKSTLLGSLTTGLPDDGKGKTRVFSDFLPHEIERGLSAELSHLIYGFTQEGEPILMKNPLDKKEMAHLIEKCHKFISFVDCPGHAPWLRTAIRGILGQKIDYALLTISAEDGITPITKEHMGIAYGMNYPVIVVITMIDKVSREGVRKTEKELFRLVRSVGHIPYRLEEKSDIDTIAERVVDGLLTPVMGTSAITMEGMNLLNYLLFRLPSTASEEEYRKPFLLFIDKVFSVRGAGTVVTGTVSQGVIKKGQDLLLGPIDANFREVRALSIMQHHYLMNQATVGDLIGISLRGAPRDDIRRGMVVTDDPNPQAIREFEAEIFILNHPTRIREGYEPIIHLNTISESAKFIRIYDKDFLCTGDMGRVRIQFKYHSHFVREGDQFLFRESKSKGLGGITRVLPGVPLPPAY
jgi:elongation factor 1-alpha